MTAVGKSMHSLLLYKVSSNLTLNSQKIIQKMLQLSSMGGGGKNLVAGLRLPLVNVRINRLIEEICYRTYQEHYKSHISLIISCEVISKDSSQLLQFLKINYR